MGLLDGLLRCEEHGCPMLNVEDNYVCLFEHVDIHLGSKQIQDVIPGNKATPATLVFHDGHTIPLFCAHCGDPLQIHAEITDPLLDDLTDLYLVGLGYYDPEHAVHEALLMGFARNPDPPDQWGHDGEFAHDVLVHLDSARQIACPNSCPQR